MSMLDLPMHLFITNLGGGDGRPRLAAWSGIPNGGSRVTFVRARIPVATTARRASRQETMPVARDLVHRQRPSALERSLITGDRA
jgi:hypothetical protein